LDLIDYSKYIYDGWGLSEDCLRVLESLIVEKNLNRAIEFGSGQSTYFLKDVGMEYVSFDDDLNYSAKCSNVLIRPLKQLSNDSFNKTIVSGYYDIDEFNVLPRVNNKHSRQQNCFYEIEDEDLSGKYDLIILDGPNGNGRSVAFSFIAPFVSDNCYLLIDDYDHYPFVEHFRNLYPRSELYHSHNESLSNQYQIYRIIL
jgi:hypothetical protein